MNSSVAGASRVSARVRELPRRPRRRLKPFNPSQGPWLIWSHYWGCWHERSATGGAAGYTNDIAHAGVFDADVARAYHETDLKPSLVRNEAVPAAKAIGQMEARLRALTAARDEFAGKVARVRSALQTAQQTDPPGKPDSDSVAAGDRTKTPSQENPDEA